MRVGKYMYVLFVLMALSLRAGGGGGGVVVRISAANYENCLIIACTLQFEILVTDSPDSRKQYLGLHKALTFCLSRALLAFLS